MNGFGFFVLAVVCIVILLVLSTIIVFKYASNSRMETEMIKSLSGERNLYNNIYNGKSDIYIVIKAINKIPVHISGDVMALMGIKNSDIQADLYALKRGVASNDVNAFKEQFSKWDKKTPLERNFEFVNQENELHKFGRITLTYNSKEDNYYLLIRDVTDETEESRRINDELENIRNLNKYRNEFIANISHEIRTPINSIQGQLQLAKMNAGNPDEVKRYASGITDQTNSLLSMLNDMFDISKIEAGNIVLDNEEFDIMAIAKKLRDTYEMSADALKKKFTLEMSDLNVRYLMGDELRVQQILMAFITRAQEVTPEGETIYVSLRQMNSSADKANFMFRIRDKGKKTSQEEAMLLLEAGGSGNMSMAVANQLIIHMGGQVMFNSGNEGNDYSIFLTFTLADRVQDLNAEIEDDALINKEFTFEGCKILMAEDNEMNADIAKELLEMMGAEVDIAENGQIAVEKFMKGGQGRYDVILMDIQMPVMNGLEAAKKLRSLYGAEARTIPIIALSANAFVEDKNRSLEAGMNGHLAKPIDFDLLKKELAKYL